MARSADSELEAELEEATSELLDLRLPSGQLVAARKEAYQPINRLVTPSPFQLASPAPAYSATSKLIPIRDDEDVAAGPSKPSAAASARKLRQTRSEANASPELTRLPAKITIKGSSEDPDDHDWLPSGGLYSTDSLRPFTPTAMPPPGTDRTGAESPRSVLSVPRSPLAHARGKLQDVWLNEFGERVVNGQVVGQLQAGRRRAPSPLAGGSGTVSAPASQLGFRSRQDSEGHTVEDVEKRKANTPAFFMQSFPTAVPGRRRSMDLSDPTKQDLSMSRDEQSQPKQPAPQPDAKPSAHTPDLSFLTADDSVDDDAPGAAASGLAQSEATHDSLPRAASPIRRTASAMRSPLGVPVASASSAAVTEAQTRLMMFPASIERAQEAGETSEPDDSDDVDSPPRTETTSPAKLRSLMPPTSPMSVGARAAALFTTPLIRQEKPTPAPAAPSEASDGDGDEEAGTSQLSRSLSMPNSPELSWRGDAESPTRRGKARALDSDAEDADDTASEGSAESVASVAASLQSLPASIRTISSLAPSAISDRSQSSIGSGGHHRRTGSRGSIRGGSSVFAKEVRIRGWSEVGEKARGWVVFHIRIVTKQGLVISIPRRFSSFVSLHKQLLAERPEYARLLPALPPRRTGILHKYGAKHLETRRKGLQSWLEAVMLDARWAECTCLQEWIL